ncbi:homeobox-leucine zipper protein HOX19 [Musa acuminata AAA Group]|uniref:(wild Malaysian banana) hypothetical protein n=1 Tax=Musa acuminata subsp. malaccensis TaxID=214687 RepID=A0A804K308_MUSAM|nr:PREDICTED: homeobox-leucine zipper protein HOX19-like [Musa acuminata subsp. malaccensis]CAG1830607.1 unnamed protein product [Musa acuminata subsp. malaccensis]
MEKSREVELCDTGLSLELGIGGKSTTWSTDHRSMAQRQASLTLSLSDEGCGGEAVQEAEAYKGCVEGGQLRPSSPLSHSTVSSFSAAYPQTIKKEKEVVGGEEAEVELATFRGARDDDNDGSGRKKLRLTKEQSAMLEDRFKEHSNLNPKQKHALAKQLNLRPRQVEVWFQNRRARTKLKQTEVDRELLKRCCESLTVENRRLRKELQELKALKFTPPLYMQLPAATLTMCPSCNRVGGSADSCNSGGAEEFAAAPPTPRFFNPFIHSATC